MMPALQEPSTRGPARSEAGTGSVSRTLEDNGLLIYDRYTHAFEPVPPEQIPESCVRLRPDEEMFIIEAPLNSVEVLEAVLKPKTPFQVHTAHLIPRSVSTDDRHRQLVAEYAQGQGKLASSPGGAGQDREVSFIVVPRDVVWMLQCFNHFMWPVQLQYMSLPVRQADGTKTTRSPYAVVCYNGHGVYKKKLRSLLKDQRLGDCKFERSLLRPGTVPLPETLREYVDGEPGKDMALPYYQSTGEEPKARGRLTRMSSTDQVRRAASQTVRRAVSRVSLRRMASSNSVAVHQ